MKEDVKRRMAQAQIKYYQTRIHDATFAKRWRDKEEDFNEWLIYVHYPSIDYYPSKENNKNG